MQKTLAVVNLNNLRYNASFVRNILGDKKFYAVVKADGYGHGGARVALAIENIVDGFCVAITDEGAALRLAGITKPVLVLSPPLGKDDVLRAKFYNLTLTVNSLDTAKLIGGCHCHIKVNTGMNRLGCNLKTLPRILNALKSAQIEGVYSHMYDPSDGVASERQLELFDRAEKLVKTVTSDTCAHLAASGGVLSGKKYLKDGARCGILLYGYPPEGFKADVKPVLKVFARRTQVTEFIGGGAGYAHARKNYKYLSVYRLGYADGFARTVPLGENNLCMDAFLRVEGGELLPVLENAEHYAKRCGTISYEVLCAATRRAEIIYEE
ncbi:MAG: alanine racemase [Clostridiales bacterium]|nr:alanine racemase [Clostridiales bacterium]